MDINVAKFYDISVKTHGERTLLWDSAKRNENMFIPKFQNLCFHICIEPLVLQTPETLHHWESPPWHWDPSLVWFHQSMPFERKECMRGRERRESHLFSLLGTSGRLESIAEACESNSGGGLLTNKPFWVTRFNESLLPDIGENEKHTTVQSDLDAAAPGILIHDITTYSNHSFLYVIFPQSNLLAGLMQNTKS